MSEIALLTTLAAAEQAAVYGYAVLGSHLDDRTRRAAVLAYDVHRARRDSVLGALRARGAPLPSPAAAYDVVVSDGTQALALAVRLETGLGQRWRDLVTGTDDQALRALAVAGLSETAVRAAEWRRRQGVVPPTVALPGS